MSDSSSSLVPPTLDAVASARWLQRAQASWLNEEVGQRMQARLQWIRHTPAQWLDWWPLNGGLQTHALVRARYPDAHVQWVERTEALTQTARQALRGSWWQRLRGRDAAQARDAAAGSVEMLWANMALHWAAEPMALLRQWQQWLAPEGFVMFSCLGPDTLRELNAVYAEAGWPPCAHAYTDMHDWGDMLVQAGFAEPVMDMERIRLTYPDSQALWTDLRAMGRNLHRQRFAGLRGRAWQAQWHDRVQQLVQPDEQGRLVLTVEVIYGHALKGAPRAAVSSTSEVSLQDMRAMLKTPPPLRK